MNIIFPDVKCVSQPVKKHDDSKDCGLFVLAFAVYLTMIICRAIIRYTS